MNINGLRGITETSETSETLQILHFALLLGNTVGNVGKPFRVSYVPTPRLPPGSAVSQ